MLSSRSEIERIRNSLILTSEILAAQLVADFVGPNPIKLAHLAIRLPAVITRLKRLMLACESMLQQFTATEARLVAGMALDVGSAAGLINNPQVRTASSWHAGKVAAPVGLAGIAQRLKALDDRGTPTLRIEKYPSAVIVYVPGTQSASFGWTANPMDMRTNLQSFTGLGNNVETGIASALAEAKVGPKDRIMLVGHSQGGMVAINAAKHSKTNQFPYSIEKVITFGSPVGIEYEKTLPNILAVENKADLVPNLDTRSNPHSPNWLTLSRNMGGGLVSSHLMETYRQISLQIDAENSRQIADFTEFASGEAEVSYVQLSQGPDLSN